MSAQSTPIESAAISLIEAFEIGGTFEDIGPHLTCSEADMLADLCRVTGHGTGADALLESHAASDDEGDAHYIEPVAS